MSELKPANENPWYVLMTLYGEQVELTINSALHKKNCAAWNAWACQALNAEARNALADAKRKVDVPKNGAWVAMETEVRAALKKRAPRLAYEDLPNVSTPINLSGVEFLETFVFVQMAFTHRVNFNSSMFKRNAYFYGSTFTKDVNFHSATFMQDANFELVTFTKGATISSAKFMQEVTFVSTNFLDSAGFDSTTFKQRADFSSAKFTQQPASFQSVNFEQQARFFNARFLHAARFESAGFTKTVDFQKAHFERNANFNSATFMGQAYFSDARFGKGEDLKHSGLTLVDAEFTKPAIFRDTSFLDSYPDFTGAIINDKTIFPWKDENWPKLSMSYQPVEEARDSCAFLRHHLSRQGLPEAELFFFKREMRFAGQIGSWAERLPYRFYGWSSDYGSSIMKPCYGLLAIWLVPALIYMCVFAWQETMGVRNYGPFEAFGFSFSNIFKFFGLQRVYFDDTLRTLGPWLETLAAAQTVLGFTALFFLGLGLRQRFRLR